MKVLLVMLLWTLLLMVCWPLAAAVLILWPVVWLLSLPFRVVGIAAEAVLALFKSILFLPARVLGYRPGR